MSYKFRHVSPNDKDVSELTFDDSFISTVEMPIKRLKFDLVVETAVIDRKSYLLFQDSKAVAMVTYYEIFEIDRTAYCQLNNLSGSPFQVDDTVFNSINYIAKLLNIKTLYFKTSGYELRKNNLKKYINFTLRIPNGFYQRGKSRSQYIGYRYVS